ncbi:hypothetical protein N0V94_008823 [Neodidymelliopsis sp. IMI 364377]|nr:hypothetical protein N0V94_008823 [Neodidymelliopsis sp. IMI 364377]
MPTYHARGITVRLGSMPLAETTTSKIVLKKGEVAKHQSEVVEKELLRSFLLDEERVLFPGDPDGYELNWLGNAPFMQVQAESGFTTGMPPRLLSSYENLPRHQTTGDNSPQALALHVKLSDKAFVSGFTSKTHLKIEVLFNGQLSACSLIHTNDVRSGAKSLHQVFAGYRLDFLAERPWVLLPPFTNADGGARLFHKTISSEQRWEQINAALLEETKDRGTSKDGERPPSAVFLHALANMQMPECVKHLQKPGGRKFGIVDVVITAGTGSKLTTGTSYLKRPQRLRDPSFAVRAAPRFKATTGVEHSTDTVDDPSEDAELEAITTNAEDDSNVDHDRPFKRPALDPDILSTRLSIPNLDQESPFAGAHIPYLPPPVHPRLPASVSPTASRVSPRCPSSDHRSDGHKEPLPSPTYNHLDNKAHELNVQDRTSDASRIFQEYHSTPASPGSSIPTPYPVYPSPTTLPFYEPADCGRFGYPSCETPELVAAPLVQSTVGYNKCHPPSTYTGEVIIPKDSTGFSQYNSSAVPTALMQTTTVGYRNLPITMTPAHVHSAQVFQQDPFGFYSSPPISQAPPNGLPGASPLATPFFEYPGARQYTAPVGPPPVIYQQLGPMPPTAIFTVTSKPKRGVSSLKDTNLGLRTATASRMLVSRVVIKGLVGRVLVDHHWDPPRRIALPLDNASKATKENQDKTSSYGYSEQATKPRKWKQGTSRSIAVHPRSRIDSPVEKVQPDAVKNIVEEARRDSIQDGQDDQAQAVTVLSLPYLKRHQGPGEDQLPANPAIDVPDRIATFVLAPPTTATTASKLSPKVRLSSKPAVPQRRALPRNFAPGIQGPKATPFLLDNPEEFLRETARARRSRSPTKPKITPCAPPTTPPARLEPTTDPSYPQSSSPLSSVPCSPVVEAVSDLVMNAGGSQDQLPQLDGSPERTIRSTSPRKLQTPSPTKSQSSNPTETKKRKTPHQSPARPPRSPGRLKTIDNPPLNDDCVIAFAESKDKSEEKGVLRQVKGERQGVFKEEYVVLAVRFFIAGD